MCGDVELYVQFGEEVLVVGDDVDRLMGVAVGEFDYCVGVAVDAECIDLCW